MAEFPPLPEVWGNYAIRGIEEVLPPQAISWWPQTPGWRYLGAALCLLLTWYVWRRLRHWVRNRYRRQALRELELLRAQYGDNTELLYPLARLLKATALQAFPRENAAGLSGEAWTLWLDSQVPQAILSGRSRQLLSQAQYRPRIDPEPKAIAELARQVGDWIRNHRNPLGA